MDSKLYVLSGCSLVVAVTACILAVTGEKNTDKTQITSVPKSSASIELLGSRMTKLEKQMRDISGTLQELKSSQERRTASRVKIDENAPEDLNAYLVSLNDAMYQLEEIVDASGLKSIATNMAVDPSILKNMYDEQLRRKKETEFRENMTEINIAQHKADKQEYGEEIKSLYESARFRFGRGGGGNQEEARVKREKAKQELLENYPDANSTAMVVAESAIGAAFRSNLKDVESNYALLMENDKRAQVVTDWGMKAAPTIQYYLASQYIEKGRTQEAEDMIYQLEQSGDDMVFGAGRQRGRPGYKTTKDAVSELRKQLEK